MNSVNIMFWSSFSWLIKSSNTNCYHSRNFHRPTNEDKSHDKCLNFFYHIIGNTISCYLLVQFNPVNMKLLNLASNTSYRFALFIAKLNGFVFFSVKNTLNGVKFHQNWIDCVIFVVSFSFNLILSITAQSQKFNAEIKSPIIKIGLDFLFKLSLFSIVFTKLINMIGWREVFNVLKQFELIDKKVCEKLFYSISKRSVDKIKMFYRWKQQTLARILKNFSQYCVWFLFPISYFSFLLCWRTFTS